MLFLFLFISSLSFAEIRFKDDVGREIVLEKPLTRVVVASRYNNELIRAIGNIKNVISVDDNTTQDRIYWKDFDPKNSIGKGQNNLNYEKIIATGGVGRAVAKDGLLSYIEQGESEIELPDWLKGL